LAAPTPTLHLRLLLLLCQPLPCAEERCRQHDINSLDVRHVVGDPRSRSHMKRLVDVTKFKAAFVVCGECEAVGVGVGACVIA
jgi:hypothetical protein